MPKYPATTDSRENPSANLTDSPPNFQVEKPETDPQLYEESQYVELRTIIKPYYGGMEGTPASFW
jgi:hypothetical protein